MSCRFRGELGGIPAQSFRGTLERAGARTYLLLGVEAGGRWIVDLEGIDQPGPTTLSITLISPDGTRFQGRTRANILQHGEMHVVSGVSLTTSSEQGQQLVIGGEFSWECPSAPSQIVGQLRALLEDVEIGPISARFLPFNEGWRLEQATVTPKGEGVTLSIEIPSLESSDIHQIQVFVVRAGSDVEGNVAIQTLASSQIDGRMALQHDALALRIEARLEGSEATSCSIRLQFTGKLGS